MTEVMYLIL